LEDSQKRKEMEEEMKTRNRKRGITENKTEPSSSTEDIATDVFSEMEGDCLQCSVCERLVAREPLSI
jgi:hypothetical protein